MSVQDQKQSDDKGSEDIDMTPLLDVIFIVLIFFVVSASFVQEQGLEIRKSHSSLKSPVETTIIVKLLEQGDVEIDGSRVAISSIKSVIFAKLSESQQGQLSLKVHKRAKTDSLISVLDEIAEVKSARPSVSLLRS